MHVQTAPEERRRRPASAHRPALDGLRAVAVVAVIAYHLSWPVLGGFLGVDTFFVLSGYLITSLLLAEHASTGRIDLPAFWSRRARRLLPALLLLVLVVSLAVAANAPVLTLEARRGDLMATLLHYANWHFIATDQSYFAQYTGASPLRHAWSLAIEEQFYVAWPVLVLLLLLVARGRLRVLVLVTCAGAAASAWAMAALYDDLSPSRAYFGTETRAHQLLIGALLAMAMHRFGRRVLRTGTARVAQVAGGLAAVVLLGMMLLVLDTEPSYYRGLSVAVALVVALLVWSIEVAPDSLVARLLSVRPAVLVGRLSYGLYLWHWPALLWSGAGTAGSAPRTHLLAIGVTVLGALASYALVEAPVRQGRVPWLGMSPRRLAIAAPAALVLVTATAVSATTHPSAALARQVDDHSVTPCPGGYAETWCVRVAPRSADLPTVAVVGDSTSLALDPGMQDFAREHGWGYVQAGRNGCSFLPLALASGEQGAGQGQRCAAGASALLIDVAKQVRPDIWLVADSYVGTHLHADGGVLVPDDARRQAVVVAALRAAVTSMAEDGGRVVLVRKPPPGEPVDCALGEELDDCGSSAFTAGGDAHTERVNAIYERAAAGLGPRVSTLDVTDLVCRGPEGRCSAAADGTLVRYDGVHYTAAFSRQLVPALMERLAAAQ